MTQKLDQSAYWDQVARQKTFNHQIEWDLLSPYITPESRILDFGCGYGRLTGELVNSGYTNAIGLDSSAEMINRAKQSFKEASFIHHANGDLPFPDHHFDAVLLFAVLTSIPLDEDQKAIIDSISRVLKPGGALYISDLLINLDQRNLKRYHANSIHPYGVFELKEGALFRHHSLAYLGNDLLKDFEITRSKLFQVETMNGNKSNAIQLIAQSQLNQNQ